MELSIIIVSHNVKELLSECIDSIYTHLGSIEFEILIIDNNSADGTCEALRQKFNRVHIIANNSNVGFSEANNQGIRIVKGEYILLLNPDTKLIDSSLLQLLEYAKINRNNIIAPRLLNADGSVQVSAWKDKTLLVMKLELFRMFIDRYPLVQYNTPTEVANVAGAAMLFHRSIIDTIGNLDNNLFWMEDFDFCYRVREVGGKVIYYPASSIIHHSGASKQKNLSIAYANANISKLKFYKKHFSVFSLFMAEIIIFLHILSRLTLFALLALLNGSARKQFKAYVFTLKKYFRYVFTGDGSIT